MDSSHTSSSSSEPQLREHVYDGIQEYDQKLPNWWLFTLYITIVWFVVAWLAYYQFGIGTSDEAKMDAFIAEQQAARDKQMGGITDAQLWELSKDPKAVEAGKATFMTPGMCVTCHAPDLSGTLGGAKLPGLPLNDQEWKHGGTPLEMLTIIRKGAPDVTKGMIAWEPVLGVKRVTEVAAFILSHHKEGEPVKLAADSPKLGGAAAPAPAAATTPPAAPAAPQPK
jgi:cytochrome c oxidase cbb3-type subunit 3